MPQRRFAVTAFLAVAAASPLLGDITVTRIFGPETFTVNELVEVGPSTDHKWRVKITANDLGATPLVLAVEADDSYDLIEYLRVEVNDPSPHSNGRVELFVRAKSGTSGLLVGVEEVQRVSDDATADGELWIKRIQTDLTTGNTGGHIGIPGSIQDGYVKAEFIGDPIAAGGINALQIHAFNSIGSTKGIGLVHADGDITSGGIRTDGRIGLIEAVGALGHTQRNKSTAVESEVEIGNIVAEVIRPSCSIVAASGATPKPIRRIECDSCLAALVSCSTLTAEVTGTGEPGLIISQTLGDPGASGVIAIHGDLEAKIEGGTLSTVNRLWIGGSLKALTGEPTIELASLGLRGDIVVNGNDDGGEWEGGVKVGSITPAPGSSPPDQAPHHTRPGEELGYASDGAVGLAPFHLLAQDCQPESCETVEAANHDFITLAWYGPVIWDPEEMPLMVEVSVPYPGTCPPSGLTWFDVTGDFTVDDYNADTPRLVIPRPENLTVHFIAGRSIACLPRRTRRSSSSCGATA